MSIFHGSFTIQPTHWEAEASVSHSYSVSVRVMCGLSCVYNVCRS